MKNHLKPLADALLPYGYTVVGFEEKNLTLRAGNGMDVKFELLKMSPLTASLSEGDEWAVRQIADVLRGHPAFTFIREPEGDIPWKVEIKESAAVNAAVVRSALYGTCPKIEDRVGQGGKRTKLRSGRARGTRGHHKAQAKEEALCAVQFEEGEGEGPSGD
jgi:hypothetical protein